MDRFNSNEDVVRYDLISLEKDNKAALKELKQLKFVVSYKGEGMCNHCACQSDKDHPSGKKMCSHYGATCQSVSRNCTGIKYLKL